jgi:cytoskeletal protein RodZ
MPVELPHRNPAEPEIIDSGVHVRDSETAPATGLQMTLVAALIVAILSVFFYGLNSQRNETTGPATASSASSQQAQNVPPAETQQKAQTTGQAAKSDAPNPKNPQGATRQQQPQKTNATPPQQNGGQNATRPATAPQKNQ